MILRSFADPQSKGQQNSCQFETNVEIILICGQFVLLQLEIYRDRYILHGEDDVDE